MKRILAIALALVLMSSFASCGKNNSAETTVPETSITENNSNSETVAETEPVPETTAETEPGETSVGSAKIDSMTCDEILDAVYAGLEENSPMVGRVEITAENSEYYLGVPELECESAMASEAMIGSIAHSICVAKFADGTDIEAMKTQIREGIDPRKWICVGVEDEDVIVESVGNTVILILDNEIRDSYRDNFLALAD